MFPPNEVQPWVHGSDQFPLRSENLLLVAFHDCVSGFLKHVIALAIEYWDYRNDSGPR